MHKLEKINTGTDVKQEYFLGPILFKLMMNKIINNAKGSKGCNIGNK